MEQQRVYEQLRDAIYSHQIKPGEKLRERQLALRFKTSRVPLRESILRLASEGLITRAHKQSSFVQDCTDEDVREIWIMRRLLEPQAARLAAEQRDRSFVAKLYLLADRMGRQLEQKRRSQAIRSDNEFHRVIVEHSGCKLLLRSYDLLHIPVRLRLPIQWPVPDQIRKQHRNYARIIEQGDADRAEQVARAHVAARGDADQNPPALMDSNVADRSAAGQR